MGLFGMFGSREGGGAREAAARQEQAKKIVGNILEHADVPKDKFEALKQKLEVAANSQLSMGMDETAAADQITRIFRKEMSMEEGTPAEESMETGSDSLRESLKGLVEDPNDEGAMREFVLAFAQSEGLGAAETSDMMKAVKGFIEQYPQFLPKDANDEAQLDRFIGAVQKQIEVRRGVAKAA